LPLESDGKGITDETQEVIIVGDKNGIWTVKICAT